MVASFGQPVNSPSSQTGSKLINPRRFQFFLWNMSRIDIAAAGFIELIQPYQGMDLKIIGVTGHFFIFHCSGDLFFEPGVLLEPVTGSGCE